MRFIFSVIGVAVVLWASFVWRFDGQTPAQYAVQVWNSPKAQDRLQALAQELPFTLPKALQPAPIPPKVIHKIEVQARKLPDRIKGEEPEPYTDKDRRELDALIDRAQNSRND